MCYLNITGGGKSDNVIKSCDNEDKEKSVTDSEDQDDDEDDESDDNEAEDVVAGLNSPVSDSHVDTSQAVIEDDNDDDREVVQQEPNSKSCNAEVSDVGTSSSNRNSMELKVN